MAHARLIRQNFYTDPLIAEKYTIEERYFLIGLACHADDFGRFWYNEASIRATIFPTDESITKDWIKSCLKKFKDEDPELNTTISWLNSLEKAFYAEPSSDLVQQINSFRRIKDDAYKINKEFGEIFGQDFVDSAFSGTKEEFFSYYEKLNAVVAINDVMPQLFTSLLNESANKDYFKPPIEPLPPQETPDISEDAPPPDQGCRPRPWDASGSVEPPALPQIAPRPRG